MVFGMWLPSGAVIANLGVVIPGAVLDYRGPYRALTVELSGPLPRELPGSYRMVIQGRQPNANGTGRDAPNL